MSGSIECQQHDNQKIAYVCHHLLQCLEDERPRGLYIATDEEGDINAYCDACEDYRCASGGEWPEDANDFMNAKIICLECFGRIRKLSGYEVN